MSIDTWGDKPKSQVDASTVDEEIDLKIQDHLDDPDAHIETGQSLQSHKASVIIDHIAKSIVEDKIDDLAISSRCITTDQIVGKDIRTAEDVGAGVDGVAIKPTGIEMWQGGEKKVDIPVSGNPIFKGEVSVNSLQYLKLTFQSSFESVDGFEFTDNIDFTFAYLNVNTLTTLNDVQTLRLRYDDYADRYPDEAKNPIFEAMIAIYTPYNSDLYFGNVEPVDETGWGFHVYNSSLRAVYYDQDNTYHYQTISAADQDNIHIYRTEFYDGDRIDWLVDGVVVYSLDISAIDPPFAPSVTVLFYAKTRSDTHNCSLTVFRFLYQQDL